MNNYTCDTLSKREGERKRRKPSLAAKLATGSDTIRLEKDDAFR